jgi:hypothetical protein
MGTCCSPAQADSSILLRGDPADIISLLVIAPLAESLLLVGVFELVRRCHAPQTVQVFTAALFISALHIRPLVATRHYRLAVVLYSGGRVSALASYLLEDGILRPDSDSRTRQSFSGPEWSTSLHNAAPRRVGDPNHYRSDSHSLFQSQRFEGRVDVVEVNVK